MTNKILTIALGTGSGTTTPTIGTHSEVFDSDVEITATPTTGYVFHSFHVSSFDEDTDYTENPHTVSMDSNVYVTVNFSVVAVADSYCTLTMVKDRLIIASTDTTFDTTLTTASTEASRLVDIFLKPYTSVPLVEVSDQVAAITADFAASIVKRRLMPRDIKIMNQLTPEGLNQVEATGWWAAGLKKLEEYIRSYYTLAVTIGNSVYNQQIYMDLFKKGVITAKEARTAMTAAATAYITEVDSITKTLTETITKTETDTLTSTKSETETKSKTVTDTETKYHTKTQNKFGTISSDPDSDGYQVDS